LKRHAKKKNAHHSNRQPPTGTWASTESIKKQQKKAQAKERDGAAGKVWLGRDAKGNQMGKDVVLGGQGQQGGGGKTRKTKWTLATRGAFKTKIKHSKGVDENGLNHGANASGVLRPGKT